jgi:phosphatidate cytidylyltransferase
MFKQRLLTAALLIPAVLFVIYSGMDWLFNSLVLVLLAALSFEYTQLIPLRNFAYKIIFVIASICLIWPMLFLGLFNLLILDLIIWLGIFIALLSDPINKPWWGRAWLVGLSALIILPVFASTLLELYLLPSGRNYILYVLCIVWATDIGAYLVGKLCGKNKLIPWISPGKTIEGMLGGLGIALIIVIFGWWLWQPTCIVWWFISGVGTIFMAMIGDLFISMLKRRCHLKDTGAILPGHGGVLDRLDSLLSALPFFFWTYSFCFAPVFA